MEGVRLLHAEDVSASENARASEDKEKKRGEERAPPPSLPVASPAAAVALPVATPVIEEPE